MPKLANQLATPAKYRRNFKLSSTRETAELDLRP